MDYKKAGVDIEAGYKSVELMKEHVAKTMRPEVLAVWEDSQVHFQWISLRIWKSQHLYPVQTVSVQS